MGMPTATVRLTGPDGSRHVQAAVGTGPVDAAYKAIDQIVGAPNTLLEFSVHAVTEGIDAQGEVSVRIQGMDGLPAPNPQREISLPRTYGGYGADTDIIVASTSFYLSRQQALTKGSTCTMKSCLHTANDASRSGIVASAGSAVRPDLCRPPDHGSPPQPSPD
jgi:2-isopropylmalate synthase